VTRALIEYVAPWLVEHPDAVEIEEIENERGTIVIEVTVHPDDVGKIIGKRGRIIRSLRTLAKASGQRDGESITVEVVD
jgi:uncharacterized protein